MTATTEAERRAAEVIRRWGAALVRSASLT